MKLDMFIIPSEAISTIYCTNPYHSNTNIATSLTKPLLPYTHPHPPVVHPVFTDEVLEKL
jgi:hypothetical protein